jgi:hypothetical protein
MMKTIGHLKKIVGKWMRFELNLGSRYSKKKYFLHSFLLSLLIFLLYLIVYLIKKVKNYYIFYYDLFYY